MRRKSAPAFMIISLCSSPCAGASRKRTAMKAARKPSIVPLIDQPERVCPRAASRARLQLQTLVEIDLHLHGAVVSAAHTLLGADINPRRDIPAGLQCRRKGALRCRSGARGCACRNPARADAQPIKPELAP